MITTLAEMEARGWPEDAAHENGSYQNKCCHCGEMFIGHKRRVSCKPCSNKKPEEITMKTKKPVVADIWATLVSKRGLGQRTGREQIVDKGWINEKGELIHHGAGTTHQEWAIKFLRDTKDPASKTPEGKDLMRVDDILLERGYIRVQIYDNAGMGLQGKPEAIKAYGHAALALLPKPKRVYVAEWPSGETSLYTADELVAIGLA